MIKVKIISIWISGKNISSVNYTSRFIRILLLVLRNMRRSIWNLLNIMILRLLGLLIGNFLSYAAIILWRVGSMKILRNLWLQLSGNMIQSWLRLWGRDRPSSTTGSRLSGVSIQPTKLRIWGPILPSVPLWGTNLPCFLTTRTANWRRATSTSSSEVSRTSDGDWVILMAFLWPIGWYIVDLK